MDTPTHLTYLSGPMTKYKDEGFGYDIFNAAADVLRAHGIDVINPAETAGGVTHLSRETFMRIDVGYVMAADSITLLPDWQESSGAMLELLLADAMGIPVYEYDPVKGQKDVEMEVVSRFVRIGMVVPVRPSEARRRAVAEQRWGLLQREAEQLEREAVARYGPGGCGA